MDKYARKQYARKSRHIKALKRIFGGACCNCGYSECSAALEFHHVVPKSFGVSRGNMTFTKRAEEAKKCVLLCANCHRAHHSIGSPSTSKLRDIWRNQRERMLKDIGKERKNHDVKKHRVK